MSDTEIDIVFQLYKLEVTQLQRVGDHCKTTHPRSNGAVIDNAGTWNRQSVVGEGGSGTVFLEENTATGVLRAVKMLKSGSESDQHREIRAMLFVKAVGCNGLLTASILLTGPVQEAVCRVSCLVRVWGCQVHLDGVHT